jgi:hypothetical protein
MPRFNGIPIEDERTRPRFNGIPVEERPISTITGKPLQTGEEMANQSSNAMRTIGPIVGDIAGTMLAPQIKGPQMGVKALNLLLRSLASGAGSGAGSVAGQALGEKPIDMQEAGAHTVLGMAGEPVIRGAGALVKGVGKKVLAPTLDFASNITPAGRMVADKAAKVMKRQQKKMIGEATQEVDDYIGALDTGVAKDDVGLDIGNVFKKRQDAASDLYTQYSDAVNLAAKGNDGNVLLDDTGQFLGEFMEDVTKRLTQETGSVPKLADVKKEVLAAFGEKPTSYNGKVLLRIMGSDSQIYAKDLKNLMANFYKNWKNTPEEVIRQKDVLKNTILADLDKIQSATFGDTAAGAKMKADTIYGNVAEFLKQTPTLKKYMQKSRSVPGLKFFESHPEKMVDDLFNVKPDEAFKIKTEILAEPNGAEMWSSLEYQWLKNIFDKGMGKTATGKRIFKYPDAIADEIYKNKKRIKAVMPDSWDSLKAKADHFRKVSEKFEPIEVDSTFGLMNAWQVLSPKSKAFAEKAAKAAGTVASKSALHLGGQAVMMNENNF